MSTETTNPDYCVNGRYSEYLDPESPWRKYSDHKGYGIYRDPRGGWLNPVRYSITHNGTSCGYASTMRGAMRVIRKHRVKMTRPKMKYYEYPLVHEEAE